MADLRKLTLAGLLRKNLAGKGGHNAPQKKKSRRDDIREWNKNHPDNQINLRTKTGRPSWWAEMKAEAEAKKAKEQE